MKIFESFKEIILENNIDNIIDSEIFSYEVGSGSHKKQNPTYKDIKDSVIDIIKHEFFDWDYFYNYIDSDKQQYKDAFEKELLPKLIKNIDKFFKEWLVKHKDTWIFNYKKKEDARDVINKHIIKSKILSTENKDVYNEYRWEYAGEKVDPKNYEYTGNKIKRKK